MRHCALFLTPAWRAIVAVAIREKCAFRGWTLHVAIVQVDHVHVVVSAREPPEGVMADLKRETTRHLRAGVPELRARTIWARHGSTRYLWTEARFLAAVRYILDDHHARGAAPDE